MRKTYPVDDRGYATDAEGEAYLRIGRGQLRKHRHYGTGPRFVRIGRSVRTSYAELDRWVAETARTCTRDDAEAA